MGGGEGSGHSCFENLFGLGTWGTWGREKVGRRHCGLWPLTGHLSKGHMPMLVGGGGQISVDSMRSRREGVQAFFSSPCCGVGVLAPPAAPRSRSRRSSCWLRWYIST